MNMDGIVPFISVVIPCRNEQGFIRECLESVLDNDYPRDKMEVLVIDGMSDDGTREIVGIYEQKYPFLKLLDNEKKIVSAALNKGIEISRGEVILRMDAHNVYDKSYIKKCVAGLSRHKADNVGGLCITLPRKNTVICRSIAVGLSHPFGVGNSYFRLGFKTPRCVDTVPFGCFRKETFEKIGMFDEDLARNQDDELNSRLIKGGGRIVLDPEIISYYYARDSIVKLWKMFYQYGYFKPLVVKKVKKIATFRQLMPVFFVGGLSFSVLLSMISIKFMFYFFLPLVSVYVLVSFAAAVFISFRKNSAAYLFSMPLVFIVLHASYGLGYLKGLFDFFVLNKNSKKIAAGIGITR